MNANGLQGEREAFEVAMRDRYNCTDHSFVRAPDGYVHAVGHRSMRMTYASVQMLWEAFQAGRASLRASPAVPVAQDKPAQFVAWAAERGHDTAHTYDTERSRWVFLSPMTADLWECWQGAALSAATPPAAVPMSQKTQDGHSTSRSGEPSTALLKQAREAILACLDATWEDADGLTVFAEDKLPAWVYTDAHQAVTALEDAMVAASRRSAAGDQPSNGHGPESAGTQQAPDMRAVCEALGFDPTNHHNAAKCPYCRPAGTQPAAKTDHIRRVPGGAAFLRVAAGTQSDTERDAARYRCVRRGQHWSVINGIGDELRAEALDAAIDAAMGTPPAREQK